jgi:hypothetical protein
MEQAMLPPINAALRSLVEHQTPAHQSAKRPEAVSANSNTAAQQTNAVSTGRLDMLSISGQLSLAKGLSVFAETLGKLLDIPRREGETLTDYAQRLSEVVRALSPADRAALERNLHQLMKGTSLRLLAEILRNPIGTEATQLSMRMEMAQFLDGDLAARAVASSYRQNAGSTLLLGSPSSPPASPPPLRHHPSLGEDTSSLASEPAPKPQPGAGANAPTQAPTRSVKPPNAAAVPRQNHATDMQTSKMSLSPDPGGSQAGPATATKSAVEPPASDRPEHGPAAPGERRASGTVNEEALRLAREHRPGGPGSRASPPSAPVLYDAPALARMSQRTPESEQVRPPQRIFYDPERLALASMSDWLMEALSGKSNAAAIRAMATPLPQFGERATNDPQPPSGTPANEEEALSVPPRNPTAEAEAETMPASAAKPGEAQRPGQPLAAELPAVPQAPVPHPLAAAILREGLPFPHVPYPASAEEPEADDPETRLVAPTDEDGGRQSQNNEASEGEREQPAEEADEGTEDNLSEADDPSVREQAQDYYWRMADWS